MSPQEFMAMDKGELVCFSLDHKPIRLKSMNAKRHPQLKERLSIKPPPLAPLRPLADNQPEPSHMPKPLPLSPWHYDPELFRKWPQYVAAERGAGEQVQGADRGNELSLGL
jgi:type IV secretory pathway TraG/TraD family ATPase VirD4